MGSERQVKNTGEGAGANQTHTRITKQHKDGEPAGKPARRTRRPQVESMAVSSASSLCLSARCHLRILRICV